MNMLLPLNYKYRLSFWGILFVSLTSSFHVVRGSSCCSGGSGMSVCALPSEEKYQIGILSSFRRIDGYFDPYGDYRSNGDNYKTSVETITLGGAYRFNEDWQGSISVPFVRNEKVFSERRETATGYGDPILEGRYLLWEDLNYLKYHPQLILYGGARLPLGVSIYNSKEKSEVDVTSEGIATLHIGVNASKLERPLQIMLDGSYFYPIERRVTEEHGSPVSPYTLKMGNQIQLVESIAYLINMKWNLGLGFKQQWQFESSVDGNSVPGSAARDYTTFVALNYFSDLNLKINVNYETSFLAFGDLVKRPKSETISLTMIYGGIL